MSTAPSHSIKILELRKKLTPGLDDSVREKLWALINECPYVYENSQEDSLSSLTEINEGRDRESISLWEVITDGNITGRKIVPSYRSFRYYKELPETLKNSPCVRGIYTNSDIPSRWSITIQTGVTELLQFEKDNKRIIIGVKPEHTDEAKKWISDYNNWIKEEKKRRIEVEAKEKGDVWIGRYGNDHRYRDDFSSIWEPVKRFSGGDFLYIRYDWADIIKNGGKLKMKKEVIPHFIGKGGKMIKELSSEAGMRINFEEMEVKEE